MYFPPFQPAHEVWYINIGKQIKLTRHKDFFISNQIYTLYTSLVDSAEMIASKVMYKL